MQKIKRYIFALIIWLFLFPLFLGELFSQRESSLRKFRVIAYNVENYFDCVKDSLNKDEEYLPGGMRGWNTKRYKQKQAHIAKVLVAISQWETAALIGLTEVESYKGMNELTRYSPLKHLDYKFIHYESPDPRGIDVVLMYHPYQFFPIHSEPILVKIPNRTRGTRDILYVKGTTVTNDTINVFVCHFPSRWGGELQSEPLRINAASILRIKVDSLFLKNPKANILIMGDFNDYPTNKSMLSVLKAQTISEEIADSELYNLSYDLHVKGKGSHKQEGEWGMLDQIIVSGNLLNKENNFHTRKENMHVFDADFLLEPDEKHLGKVTFRTYIGFKYHDGFSDHLPIYLDFLYK